MAAMEELGGLKKRKRDLSLVNGGEKPDPKHRKKALSKPAKLQATGSDKPPKALKAKSVKLAEPEKSAAFRPKKKPNTPKERRLAAKDMAETRKKKRKPNYSLEKELASLWEKMRCYNIQKEDRSKLVTETLKKMNGKFLDIVGSHVSARVLQTCVKYCCQAERDTVFEALRPHFLTLSRKKYAVHLVKKLLDTATKKQLEWFISSLHGHVASLLRHTVGSAVIEHVYHLANGSQKQSLLMEMYSAELQLFKDLTLTNSGRLVDIISKLGLQKSSVLQHMTTVIQPLLEKGIVDYSIIHTALVEYFTIADRSSAADVIQQLIPLLVQDSSAADESQPVPQLPKKMKNKKKKLQLPLLVRMMRTRDGLKVGILCVKHGSAKERKKIIKGMKGNTRKLALEQYGSLLLICILSVVDDTKLVTKIVIRELQTVLKELVLDKNGRRPLLQLLHPLCSRYLSPADLACLNLSVPSLCTKVEGQEALAEAGPDKESEIEMKASVSDNDNSLICGESVQLAVEGKKDPSVRRRELLLDSGLAESLIATCIENAGELLRSNFGKEVIYEVAVGGTDGVLQPLADRLAALHKAIASLAALPKMNEAEEEHVFENFHSSRTIRKLILDCSTFAVTLWKIALEGKCEMWAQGHSCKVVTAFLESSDTKVKDMVKSEMQPLIDRDVLKVPENKAS
ncbi:pumilio homolog 24 [Phoenix dactylifera]|uniref:Pumilio homolog 24 n=1 Tax=Phoenix dactylifera TaxID=42345 RepID=A0A8B7CZU2_PHODC|nr:pumilio homolog 24 [Phoenix dactylifera]